MTIPQDNKSEESDKNTQVKQIDSPTFKYSSMILNLILGKGFSGKLFILLLVLLILTLVNSLLFSNHDSVTNGLVQGEQLLTAGYPDKGSYNRRPIETIKPCLSSSFWLVLVNKLSSAGLYLWRNALPNFLR
ncbi:hypothetical protein [Shewanella mangrovisoli]|uniref:hypothetical protein n=1 Tax=Shewanella mangrovisoli TaxID=2864211 RepID=UPI0035BB8D8E